MWRAAHERPHAASSLSQPSQYHEPQPVHTWRAGSQSSGKLTGKPPYFLLSNLHPIPVLSHASYALPDMQLPNTSAERLQHAQWVESAGTSAVCDGRDLTGAPDWMCMAAGLAATM